MSGWAKVDYEALDKYLHSLDGTAWKVYLALLRYANADGACWPSQALIADKTGLRERSVRYAIARLGEAGLLETERQPGKPTVYRITPAPQCRPEDEGAAPSCLIPRHDGAGTPAPPCRQPRHHRAIEQDTRTNYKNKSRRTRAKKFVEPSLEEVQAYCRERGNHIDAQRFLDHYESNGWRVGRNAMKDWRAAVRTWERNSVASGEAKKPAEPMKYRN